MGLTPSVAKVLKLVEETTGLPVHVEEDSRLPQNILAKVTMARGNIPFHQVAYKSKATEAPDYLIIYQCGFILRRYAVSSGERVDFVGTETGQRIIQQWVETNPKKPNASTDDSAGLIGFLHSGLLSQLRSIPVGLRVDEWILKEFPEVYPLQQQAVSRQLNDNAAVFRPDVQRMMPDQALRLNGAMSSAFALFWSERLKQEPIVIPYQASGYLAKGQELYELSNSIPHAPSHDDELVDAWANHLGMRSWYQWKGGQ